MGQSLSYAITTTAETSSTISKRLRVIYNTTDGVTDSSNTRTVSGDWAAASGAVSISVPFGGGTQDIYDDTQVFSKAYGSTGSKSFSASLTGIDYWGAGATITASGSTSIPARAYSAPAAPTGISVALTNSTTNTVTWTNNSTGDASTSAPYASQTLQVSVNGGAWSTVTSPSGTASSYAHTGVSRSNSYQYRVSATNSTATSAYATSSIVYATPAAPTSVSATRVSDTNHTVAWTRNATTPAPYTSQQVQRDDNATTAWVTIATGLSGAATSYSDTTTIANRQYKYRIVAVNTTASATSADSAATQTTPAAPSSAAAVKSGTDISVTWTRNASSGMTVSYEVYASQDGGAYSLLTTVGNVGSYTHTAPSASSTWQYQVRAKSTVGATLYSGYSTTGVVQLLTAPNAPTGLGPTTVADASEGRTLTWTHNPVDTTAQTKFQIRHRASGGAWTTVTAVTSATSSWVLAGGTYTNGTTVEWEVRTWGDATTGGSDGTGASVYSATASYVTSARPTATISAPADAGTLTDSNIDVAWTYYQAASSPQAQWRVTLLDGSLATLEVKSGSGTTAATTMATPGADGATYTVQVEVASAAGLWSAVASSTFGVSYLPPSAVNATVEWDRDAGVTLLTLTKAAWDGTTTIEPVAAHIDRSVDGGTTWTRTHTSLALSTTTAVVDTEVPTVADVSYRVTAISALPSTFVGTPVDITINETERAYLGYGPGFATILVFYGNLALGSGVERAESVRQFAGRVGTDNRPTGVIISGEARSRELSIAARFLNSDAFAHRDDFEAAALAGGRMLYRDPSPRVAYGRMSGLNTSESISVFGDTGFKFTEASSA